MKGFFKWFSCWKYRRVWKWEIEREGEIFFLLCTAKKWRIVWRLPVRSGPEMKWKRSLWLFVISHTDFLLPHLIDLLYRIIYLWSSYIRVVLSLFLPWWVWNPLLNCKSIKGRGRKVPLWWWGFLDAICFFTCCHKLYYRIVYLYEDSKNLNHKAL